MSVTLIWQVLDSALPPSLKLAAIEYASYADPDGSRVYPSLGRVAWRLGVTRRQAQRKTSTLIDLGILVRVKRAAPGRTSSYVFKADALPRRPPFRRPGAAADDESRDAAAREAA